MRRYPTRLLPHFGGKKSEPSPVRHTRFLWWLAESPKLKREAREAIADTTALVHVSAVSIWEIMIKAQLDRLDPGTERIDQEIGANGFCGAANLGLSRLGGGEPSSVP